ncbi:MAG: enoyl-CoA hydratase-related protein [Saprospiraceae bacterium]
MHNIITDQIEGVFNIILNRPEVYNGFNMAMAKEVQDALDYCSNNDSVRVVVLTSHGKAFSSGQDLKEANGPNAPSMRTILTEQYNPIILKIRHCPKPVIAGVNGVAAGAGANIALACDLVIASQSAKFIQAFSKIGLIPDSGGTYFLPRLIGLRNAMALMMTGDSISSMEAKEMGMIYKVVEDENFKSELNAFAKKVSEMPTKALTYTKFALYESLQNDLEQQLDCELKYQEMAGSTEDFKEGVNAFIEKRKALFNGK